MIIGFSISTTAESNVTATEEEAEICLDKSSTVIFSAIGGTAILWAVITTLYCLLRKNKDSSIQSSGGGNVSVANIDTKSSFRYK